MKKDNLLKLLYAKADFIGCDGCTEAEITKAERDLSLRFSEEYRIYLKEMAVACFASTEWTGITKDSRLNVVDVTLRARDMMQNVPYDLYVVEELNIDALRIWQNEKGTVFISDSQGSFHEIADSLEEYVRKEMTD